MQFEKSCLKHAVLLLKVDRKLKVARTLHDSCCLLVLLLVWRRPRKHYMAKAGPLPEIWILSIMYQSTKHEINDPLIMGLVVKQVRSYHQTAQQTIDLQWL